MFYITITISIILIIACIAHLFSKDRNSDSTIGAIVIIIIFTIIGTCTFFTTNFYEDEPIIIYPKDVKILSDDEEVIIKYKYFRYTTKDHLKYTKLIDSNFHITKTKYYNILHDYDETYTKIHFTKYENTKILLK